MHAATVNKLRQINLRLYQTLAGQFSATRERLQPGVARVLERLPEAVNLLDLGCGNGELLARLLQSGYRGHYLGLDFSQALLDIARSRALETNAEATGNADFQFQLADFSQPDWVEAARAGMHALQIPTWDTVFAFAMLHHIPGEATRRGLLRQIRELLEPGKKFVLSGWQFLNSARMRARVRSWSEVGLEAAAVEANDYLLDWRRGGYAYRYVHLFTEQELIALAQECAFEVSDSFYSDGEGGRMGLYHIWKAI